MQLHQNDYNVLLEEANRLLSECINGNHGQILAQWANLTFPVNNQQGDANFTTFTADIEQLVLGYINGSAMALRQACNQAASVVLGLWLQPFMNANVQFVNTVPQQDYDIAMRAIEFANAQGRQVAPAQRQQSNYTPLGGFAAPVNNRFGAQQAVRQPAQQPRTNQGYHQRPVHGTPNQAYHQQQQRQQQTQSQAIPAQQGAINDRVKLRNQTVNHVQPAQQQARQPQYDTTPTTFTEVDDVLTVTGPSTYPGQKKFKAYFRSRGASYRYPYRDNLSVPMTFNPASSYLVLGLYDDDTVGFELLEKNEMNSEVAKYAVRIRTSVRSEDIHIRTNAKVSRINGKEVDPDILHNRIAKQVLSDWIERGKVKEGSTFDGMTEQLKEEYLKEVTERNMEDFNNSLRERRRKLIEENKTDEVSLGVTVVEKNDTTYSTSLDAHIQESLLTFDGYADNSRVYTSRTNLFSTFASCATEKERDDLFTTLVAFKKGSGSTLETVHFTLLDKQIPLPIFEKLNRHITQVYKEVILTYLKDTRVANLMTDFAVYFKDLNDYLLRKVDEGIYSAKDVLAMSNAIQARVTNLVIPTMDDLKNLYPTLPLEKLMVIQKTSICQSETAKVFYLPNTADELLIEKGVQSLSVDHYTLLNKVSDDTLDNRSSYYYMTSDGLLYRILHKDFKGITIVDV